MNDDFMDYLGYKIFIGEGHEFGFGDPPEEEEQEEQDLSLYEQIDRILEPLRNLKLD